MPAGPNPIGRYLGREEIPDSIVSSAPEIEENPFYIAFQSKEGMNRRTFLKAGAAGAAALALGSLLKAGMAEAGEDGHLSVYFEDFIAGGDLPLDRYLGVEKTLPRQFASILRENGVSAFTNRERVNQDTIMISEGTFYYQIEDPDIENVARKLGRSLDPYMQNRNTVKITFTLHKDGPEPIDYTVTYKCPENWYSDSMLRYFGRDLATQIKESFAEKPKISRSNELKIPRLPNGEIDRSRLARSNLSKNIWDGLKSSNPEEIKFWKNYLEELNIIFLEDGHPYRVLLFTQ